MFKCGEEFTSQDVCNKHMEECKHSNKYPCTECEGIFDSLSTLIDHTKNLILFFQYELYM